MIEQVTEVVEDQSLFYIGEQSQMESYDQDIIRYFLTIFVKQKWDRINKFEYRTIQTLT